MKFYLAAAFGRAPELREYCKQLAGLGYWVTSQWLHVAEQHGDQYEMTEHDLTSDPRPWTKFAHQDLRDLGAADMLVAFTGGGGRGGRHVEFGAAIGWNIPRVIIGPRENVFHTLALARYDTWEQFLEALRDGVFDEMTPHDVEEAAP